MASNAKSGRSMAEINVTPLVDAWVRGSATNHGLVVRRETETTAGILGRVGPAANRPPS